MADFMNGGWAWYIAILTIMSLIGLFWLAMALSGRKPEGPVETSGHVWDEDLKEYNNPLPRWWLNLFYITIIWGALYLIAYPGLGAFRGLLGWSQEDRYQQEMAAAGEKYAPLFERYAQIDVAQLASDPEASKVGEHLYAAYCTGCHGSDARGARGFPNLRDDDWLYGGEAAQIKTTILDGRRGVMPAWAAVVGADGVKNVTAYVETLAGRQTDSVAAATGKAVFQTNCAACHGPDGKGNTMLGAPNLTDETWLHGGSTLRIAETIRAGRIGVMPAHKDVLGEAKVHLLAAYVYGLRQGAAPVQ